MGLCLMDDVRELEYVHRLDWLLSGFAVRPGVRFRWWGCRGRIALGLWWEGCVFGAVWRGHFEIVELVYSEIVCGD